MSSTTASKIIAVLRSLFARYGIPHQIVSDNGHQFTSEEEYSQSCAINGIRHTLVAPYHPSSNGEAERFVQTFKSAIQRAQSTNVDQALPQFLLRYRTTPHSTTGKTPTEMMFERRVRTGRDLLHPTSDATKKSNFQTDSQTGSNQKKLKRFEVSTPVWMRNYLGKPKWISGVVKPCVLYRTFTFMS